MDGYQEGDNGITRPGVQAFGLQLREAESPVASTFNKVASHVGGFIAYRALGLAGIVVEAVVDKVMEPIEKKRGLEDYLRGIEALAAKNVPGFAYQKDADGRILAVDASQMAFDMTEDGPRLGGGSKPWVYCSDDPAKPGTKEDAAALAATTVEGLSTFMAAGREAYNAGRSAHDAYMEAHRAYIEKIDQIEDIEAREAIPVPELPPAMARPSFIIFTDAINDAKKTSLAALRGEAPVVAEAPLAPESSQVISGLTDLSQALEDPRPISEMPAAKAPSPTGP